MSFSKEVIEFSSKGLDQLKAETKSTEKAIDDLHKANKRLKQEMRDGSWEKQARELSKTRRELQAVRQETEKLQRAQRLQSFRGQYGRVGGTAAFYGSMAAGRLQQVAGGLSGSFGGLAGLAGSVGVPLGVGALASRGFSGTAAMAKLNNEIDRLSRHIASDLLPLLEGFSRNLERVNRARDATRAGTGTFGDRVVSAVGSPYGMLGIGAAIWKRNQLWNAGKAGFGGLMRSGPFISRESEILASKFTSTTARVAGGLGSALQVGLAGYGAYSEGRAYRAGRDRFANDDDIRRQSAFISDINQIGDPAERRKRLEMEIKHMEQSRTVLERGGIHGSHRIGSFRHGLDRLVGGFTFGAFTPNEDKRESQRNLASRLAVARRMAGGESLNPNGSNGMMFVQGAGERRDGAGIYEELASSVPQMGGAAKGTSTIDDVVSVLNDIYRVVSTPGNIAEGIARAFGVG